MNIKNQIIINSFKWNEFCYKFHWLAVQTILLPLLALLTFRYVNTFNQCNTLWQSTTVQLNFNLTLACSILTCCPLISCVTHELLKCHFTCDWHDTPMHENNMSKFSKYELLHCPWFEWFGCLYFSYCAWVGFSGGKTPESKLHVCYCLHTTYTASTVMHAYIAHVQPVSISQTFSTDITS